MLTRIIYLQALFKNLFSDDGRDYTKPLIWLFLISRILFLIPKVYMRVDLGLMHLPDQSVLYGSFWRGLLMMPGQPPGFQLLVSLIDQVSFGWMALPAFVLYTLLGLVMLLCVYRAQCLLEVPPKLAAFVAFLFVISPNVILHERMLLYVYPIMCCLSVSGYYLARFAYGGDYQRRDLGTAYIFMAVPCWFHGFFNPVLIVTNVLAHIAVAPGIRRQIALVSLPALLLAALPTVKNGVMYGYWQSSTWGPFSLARVAVYWPMHLDDIEALKQEGVAPDLTRVPPFEIPFEKVEEYPRTGLALTDELKKADGSTNWMSTATLPLGKALLSETVEILKHRPELYLRGIQGAVYFYFQPTSTWFWSKNRERIRYYDQLWSAISAGTLAWNSTPLYVKMRSEFDVEKHPLPSSLSEWYCEYGAKNFPFVSPFVFLCVMGTIIYNLFRSLAKGQRASIFWVSMLLVFGYVTALSILVELSENMRFRGYLSPFVTIILGYMITSVYRRVEVIRSANDLPLS